MDRHVLTAHPPQFTRLASVLEEGVGTGLGRLFLELLQRRDPDMGQPALRVSRCEP